MADVSSTTIFAAEGNACSLPPDFTLSFAIPASSAYNGSWYIADFAFIVQSGTGLIDYQGGETGAGTGGGIGSTTGTGFNLPTVPAPNTTLSGPLHLRSGSSVALTNIRLILTPPSPVSAALTGSTPCPGQNGSLTCNIQWAASASIDNGVGAIALSTINNQPGSSQQVLSNLAPGTYTLTVVGIDGQKVVTTATITPSAFSVSLSASPSTIPSGTGTTLSWTSAGVGNVYIPGVSQYALPPNGSAQVRPTATTTYTATGKGACGSTTSSATVTVVPPTDTSAATATAKVGTSLCNPAAISAPASSNSTFALCLALDAHRRPLAAQATGAGLLGFYSNDAGYTFQGGAASGQNGVIDADTSCGCASLLLDRHTNRYRAIYSKGSPAALYTAAGPVVDGFAPDAPGAAIAGLSGNYPVAASHPTDRLFCLMAYLDGSTLKMAWSGDGGGSWGALSTVATGLSFTASGRAGLALLGETACVVYASGSTLLAKVSPDRGATWGGAVSAGIGGPYSGLSLLGWQGRLSLLAFAGSPAAPKLLVSDDLGATWANKSAGLPAVAAPSALGVIPHSGQLRLGMTHRSEDGATWSAD